MQKLIIVAALVACGLAAPLENIKDTYQTADLTRPSPINPDIPSDPKPEEKVILITDPVEKPLQQAVAKPAILPGPYVPPSVSRSKRADKDSSESDEDSSEEDKKQSSPPKDRPLAGPSSSLLQKLSDRTSTTPASSSTDAGTSDGSTTDASASSTTSAPTHPRRPYSPHIHQHNEHLFKPTTDTDSGASSTTTAVPTSTTSSDHKSDKRDIPVPLTRKNHRNDDDDDDDATKQQEQPDTTKEEVKQEEKKDEDHKAEPAPHPATISRPIPVAELFAKKPSTE